VLRHGKNNSLITIGRDAMTTWKKVGNIGVDSGGIMIADPCYWVKGEEYENQHKELRELGYFGGSNGDYKHAVSHPFDLGHEGKGVSIHAGFGDGSYDVYIKTEDCGDWGIRVTEAKVVFITEEEL